MRDTSVRTGSHIRYLLILVLFSLAAFGQQTAPRARIVDSVDNARLVTLHGNTHPLAAPEFDRGAAPDSTPAQRMLLLLSRSPQRQAALNKLLEEQQTPGSPNYRHWLTPAEFGQEFGPADSDVQTVTAWLQQQGFAVDSVSAGKSVIEFSGTAGQVRQAFHTAIHKYVVNGKDYWANASDPEIPAALAPVVEGLVSLNDFPRKSLSHRLGLFSRDKNGVIVPQYTVSNGTDTYYALGPSDFATIYNTNPLLQSGVNGAGQTIAVVGVSNVHLQDVTLFRNMFGLGAGNTSVVVDGPDPGIVTNDETESLLDLEWANAVAPAASVVLVSAENTETTSGLDLAALDIIDNNMAGVLSESYGTCEANLGTAGNQFEQSLWQQAAAEGITVVVAAGDDGSAGCDDQNKENVAQSGFAVNGIASTPYNVAVGGTDFDDAGTQSTYWKSTNSSSTLESAKSYIPETTWNTSCAATATAGNLNVCPVLPTSSKPPASLNLWSGSGGASNCSTSSNAGSTTSCTSGTPKPAWQSGPGVPADGVRDIPDVALYAAVNSNSNSFYVVCEADAVQNSADSCFPPSPYNTFLGMGGTSASAPSFAAIVALAEQKVGTRLGNINYLLYSLAAKSGASCPSNGTPSSSSSCIFNDIAKGNNSVPCSAGSPNCSLASGTGTGVLIDSNKNPAYTATSGYDLATGLGSVNAANLVTSIASAVGGFTPTTTTLSLNGATSAITAKHGDPITVGVNVSPTASSGSVSLLSGGKGIDANPLNSGGASWTSTLFPGGNYTVNAHYPGDGVHGASDSNAVTVTISAEPSQTFVNLVTFGSNGATTSFTGNSVPYGSPYVLRMDVTDASGSVSTTQGVTSKCASGTASCPTGTLTLTANGAALDGGSFALNNKGFAEDQPVQLPAGNYALSASYAGDHSYGPSAGSATVTVTKAATSMTLGTNVTGTYSYGTPFALTANVTTASSGAAPGGTVNWTDNSAATGTNLQGVILLGHPADSQGYASLSYSASYAPPSLGAHTLSGQYSGDTNYTSSTAQDLTFTVGKASPIFQDVGVSPAKSTTKIPVQLYAEIMSSSIMAAPTGTITFYDNGTALSGTVSYTPSNGSGLGPSNTISAYLVAILTTTFSQTGQHNITASYSGDGNYNAIGSTQVGSVTVYDKLSSTVQQVSSSMSPALTNYQIALSCVVSGAGIGTPTPTGTVTFSDNGQALSGPVTYSNTYGGITATMPYTFTASGSHSITASYSGDSNYTASSTATPLSLSVMDKLSTSVTYFYTNGGHVNQSVNLTAHIASATPNGAPTMTGTVEFLDGGTPLAGTVNTTDSVGSISASMDYTFTTIGTHNISVKYDGDSHYQATTSQAYAVNILGPFSMQSSFGSVTLGSSGGSHSFVFAVVNNMSSTTSVAFTCSSDSTSASCSLNPTSLNLPGRASQNVTFNYTVPALSSALYHRRRPFGGTLSFVFAGLFAGAGLTTRRKRKIALLLLMAALALTMLSCGGGGGTTSSGPPPTPTPTSKTYTFTITGTSGTYTDSQTLTVTVQSS